jgi:hypothetical protein
VTLTAERLKVRGIVRVAVSGEDIAERLDVVDVGGELVASFVSTPGFGSEYLESDYLPVLRVVDGYLLGATGGVEGAVLLGSAI